MQTEQHYDIHVRVGLSASTLLSLGERFIRAAAAAIGCKPTHLWILGSVADGGPDESYATLRVLGSPVLGMSDLDLQLSDDGITTKTRSVDLSIIDTHTSVFTMMWRSSEVNSKIHGSKGLRQSLARVMRRESRHVWISAVDAGDNEFCRITVSITSDGESEAETQAETSRIFSSVCRDLGLAHPIETIFHDGIISISNTTAEHFATKAQMKLKKIVMTQLNAFENLLDDLTITQTVWPTPKKVLVHVRFYANNSLSVRGEQNSSEEFLSKGTLKDEVQRGDTLEWKKKLFKLLHKVIDDGDLSSSLRRFNLDVDINVADFADIVFSLKTEFVQALKKKHSKKLTFSQKKIRKRKK
eukprot:SAG31_NODE_9255_length_1308_cov_0.933830_1_plen_355_part_01